MNKVIYVSYEGMLDVENQMGFEVYELENFFEVHFISVWNQSDMMFRVPKSDYESSEICDVELLKYLKHEAEYGFLKGGQINKGNRWVKI